MKINISLPSFHGTYETIWSDSDNWFYEMEHEEGITHLDEWTFDFKRYLNDLGEAYTDFIDAEYRNNICDGISLEFESTSSPREYNFSTDKIYADLTIKNKKVFEKTIKRLMDENKEALSKIIYDNHTSCSGFWSFMSNDFNEWRKTFMSDSMVLSYLLYYLLAIINYNGEGIDIDYAAYEIVDIYEGDYWEPHTEEAIAEWEEHQRKKEEEAWDRAHWPELPFAYE